MDKLLLVKLGGSVITDKSKPYTPNLKNIRRFADDLARHRGKLIIGHGGGSFPHTPAKKYQTHLGLINRNSLQGVVEVQEAAWSLNRIVVHELLIKKMKVMTFAPSSILVGNGGRLQMGFLDTLEMGLSLGVTPVVFGDVVLDTKQGCMIASTEVIFDLIVAKLAKQYDIKIIHVSDVRGVMDEKGKVISVINTRNYKKVKTAVTGSKLTDVTGGMIHKVEESLALAKKYGIEVVIGNNVKGVGGTKIL